MIIAGPNGPIALLNLQNPRLFNPSETYRMGLSDLQRMGQSPIQDPLTLREALLAELARRKE
jgi:hypothetical protein